MQKLSKIYVRILHRKYKHVTMGETYLLSIHKMPVCVLLLSIVFKLTHDEIT